MDKRKVGVVLIKDGIKYITREIYMGRTHLWIWRGLNNDLSKDRNIGQRAPAFFNLTLEAHLESAWQHIARVYDQHPAAFSLRRLIDETKRQSRDFKRGEKAAIEAVKKVEEMLVEIEPLLDKIKQHRDERLAHLDPRNIVDPDRLGREAPVTVGEMETVYKRAGEAANLISAAYDESSTLMEITQWEDYKRLIQLARRGLDDEIADRKKLLGRGE